MYVSCCACVRVRIRLITISSCLLALLLFAILSLLAEFREINLHYTRSRPTRSVSMSAYSLQSRFESVTLDRYLKFYYYDNQPIFQFFERCRATGTQAYSKQAAEHYFMQQLQAANHERLQRVYSCFEADIYVIPVSLGYLRRAMCSSNSADRDHIDSVLQQLQRAIFEHPQSCWNQNHASRTAHFMMAGGSQGRRLVRRSWVDSGIIFADSWQHALNHRWTAHGIFSGIVNRWRVSACAVSTGFTPITSYVLPSTRNVLANSSRVVIKQADDQLPQVSIVRDLKAWKHRRYQLFFMGQADNREAYKLRQTALRSLNHSDNLLVQTGRAQHWSFEPCDFDAEFVAVPCSAGHGTDRYINMLSQSKFSLMFRGDDPCSSRFWDAIALDVINIVISDGFEACLIGRTLIEWHKMFVWIPEAEFASNPHHAVYSVLSKYDDAHFENMLQFIHTQKKYILWDVVNSTVAELVLHEAFRNCILPN